MAESHREEIAKLEALYAGNPGGRVFVHLAEAYRKAGEHERARRILDEGLARHTDSASGYVVLGRVLADMQITAEAEVAFRRVLELDGGNLVALRWLGDLARQAGRNAEAASHYRELLVRNPSNEEVRDLVEIVERSDPAALPGGPESEVSELTDWAAPSAEETAGAHDETAIAEPISSLEEAAVTTPHTEEPEPADLTPWSAAPGHTEPITPAEVEYGVVEIDALPGDAVRSDEPAEHAPAAEPPAAESVQEWTPAGPAAAPTRQEADPDLVTTWDSENADGLEIDELSRDDEVEPLEIHFLDPAYESPEDEADEVEAALDIMDLSTLGSEEDVGEYADDEFLADLASVPQEALEGEDYAPPGADFTLLPAEPAAVAPAPAAFDVRETGAHPADTEEAGAPYDVVDGPGEAARAELAGASQPASESLDAAPAEAAPAEAAPAEAAPIQAAPAEAPAAEAGLMTETMAVLYRTQGFHDRAADVYRSLLRHRPGDERLAARLREAVEAASASTAAPEPEDETGEVWLRGVGAAWTATGTEGAEEATPYAWTGDPEEVESGAPISDYLRELVAWKGGQARWNEAVSESPPTPMRDADAAPPDWLMGGDADGTPWADAAAEEVASWSPAQLPAEEPKPWTPIPEPDRPSDAAQSEAEDQPADPWLQDSSAAGEAIEGRTPADAQAPADVPAEDSGAGWTPFELDRDVPAAAPTPPAPAEVPPPAVSMSAEDDPAEDEDLEMFRSWLQSLKK